MTVQLAVCDAATARAASVVDLTARPPDRLDSRAPRFRRGPSIMARRPDPCRPWEHLGAGEPLSLSLTLTLTLTLNLTLTLTLSLTLIPT